MTYRFFYLNLRARGEPIRWLLKALEVEFEEERIDFSEWPAKKAGFSWGQTPVLEIDGEVLGQTTVICRYLGEKHGLPLDEDPWIACRQQEAAEYLHDVSSYIALAYYNRMVKQDEQKEFFMNKARDRLPLVVKNIEAMITEEASWILSPKMTWVDVFVAAYLDQYEVIIEGLLNDAPKLQELLEKIRSLSPIQEWIETRPPLQGFEEPTNL